MAADTINIGGHSDANLATAYTLIHSFLISRSHDKAAAAVKKAAKDIVIIKDGVQGEEASLEEIIKWWKLKNEDDSKNDSSSDSDASSDSDSSDSSSSSDSSDSDSSSGSDSDSSGISSETKVLKSDSDTSKPKAISTNGVAVPAQAQSEKTTPEKKSKKSKSKKETTDKESSSSSSDSSSDDDSSESSSDDSDTDNATQSKALKANATKHDDSTTSTTTVKTTTVAVSVSDQEAPRTAKKRRTSESGNAVVTAVVTETTETTPTPKSNGKANGKQPRKSNTPFQRIKAETVEFHDERLKDNAFVARGASTNDYGARANQDLIVTRGDGFRKEKNKKKRGSYRGGEITMQSHSIKFT